MFFVVLGFFQPLSGKFSLLFVKFPFIFSKNRPMIYYPLDNF